MTDVHHERGRAPRVYVTGPMPDRDVYRRGVRSHDPYRHHRPYNVPQLTAPLAEAPLADTASIVAIVDRYPPVSGHMAGGETMLRHMLRDSVRRGHRVTVVSSTHEHYDHEGVEVVPFAVGRQMIGDHDVVVGHLMWTRQAVEAAAAVGRPLLYLVHNDRQMAHWRLVGDNITAAVMNSRWLSEVYERRWGGPSVIVRPPTSIDDYSLARDPWRARFTTLINANREKGAEVFYALADGPPARQYLAVEGAYGDQMRPGRDHPNVQWLPQTPNIRDHVYSRTRVLLMPSAYESYGCVAAEAMCSGIPVVAHPTPGLREVLGDAGVFADRRDIDAWRTALADLDDREFYTEVSHRCYDRAAELTHQSAGDLDTWDRLVRAAAALVQGETAAA